MTASEHGPARKIRSLNDLQAIKEQVKKQTSLREAGYEVCLTVHLGTCGIASGARDVLGALLEELGAVDRKEVRVTTSGCIGVCAHEPVMTVEALGAPSVLYGDLDAVKAREVFREHVLKGAIQRQWVVAQGV